MCNIITQLNVATKYNVRGRTYRAKRKERKYVMIKVIPLKRENLSRTHDKCVRIAKARHTHLSHGSVLELQVVDGAEFVDVDIGRPVDALLRLEPVQEDVRGEADFVIRRFTGQTHRSRRHHE